MKDVKKLAEACKILFYKLPGHTSTLLPKRPSLEALLQYILHFIAGIISLFILHWSQLD
jgi:hypothetical protein